MTFSTKKDSTVFHQIARVSLQRDCIKLLKRFNDDGLDLQWLATYKTWMSVAYACLALVGGGAVNDPACVPHPVLGR
jgi:hypothetical protein